MTAVYRVLPLFFALAALSACGESPARGPVEPTEPQPRTMRVTGTVQALDGTVPPGLQVTLTGTPQVSAPVATDGRFTIEGRVQGDSVSVVVDVASGTVRQVLPALLRMATSHNPADLRVVLVPLRWTITGGSQAGTVVDVSVDAAFRRPCNDVANINCDGFYPAAWFAGIKLWNATSLPARLAFDHVRTHAAITAADSAQFWSIVSRMNADAGLELFRPAALDEVVVNSAGTPLNGVIVRVDTTLAGFGAWANWWWNANGDMSAGLVRVRNHSALRNGSLMSHELLHTQGLKHSCSWATVMGGYGCGSTPGLSTDDVAYFQLARAVLEAQRARGAPHGLVAALQGERVVMRGLPLLSAGDLSRLRAMTGDSIGHGDEAGHRH
jgi:hypothetical protein